MSFASGDGRSRGGQTRTARDENRCSIFGDFPPVKPRSRRVPGAFCGGFSAVKLTGIVRPITRATFPRSLNPGGSLMLRGLAGVGLAFAVVVSGAGCFGGGGGTSSGTGGGSGSGTGGSTTTVMKDPSSYAQTAGATFPYPQGHASSTCGFPIYNTDDVYAAFQNWKAKFFDGTKIVRPENGNDTVSEGIGYGMLIGVFMNDQSMFDALWSFAKGHNDGHGLMTWCIPGGSGSCSGGGAATDGDEDMAYALLMASQQWPSKASYVSDATALINAILQYEVDGSNVVKPGDNFGGAGEMN